MQINLIFLRSAVAYRQFHAGNNRPTHAWMRSRSKRLQPLAIWGRTRRTRSLRCVYARKKWQQRLAASACRVRPSALSLIQSAGCRCSPSATPPHTQCTHDARPRRERLMRIVNTARSFAGFSWLVVNFSPARARAQRR